MNQIPEKYDIINEIEYNNEKYKKARNKENNNFIVFDSENNICFGGEYYWTYKFATVDGETYINAQHEINGKWAYYDRDGNIKEAKE